MRIETHSHATALCTGMRRHLRAVGVIHKCGRCGKLAKSGLHPDASRFAPKKCHWCGSVKRVQIPFMVDVTDVGPQVEAVGGGDEGHA